MTELVKVKRGTTQATAVRRLKKVVQTDFPHLSLVLEPELNLALGVAKQIDIIGYFPSAHLWNQLRVTFADIRRVLVADLGTRGIDSPAERLAELLSG